MHFLRMHYTVRHCAVMNSPSKRYKMNSKYFLYAKTERNDSLDMPRFYMKQ